MLERGNSVPRPKRFCEADKVKLSPVLSQNQKKLQVTRNWYINIFENISFYWSFWQVLRPSLPVRGPASLWEAIRCNFVAKTIYGVLLLQKSIYVYSRGRIWSENCVPRPPWNLGWPGSYLFVLNLCLYIKDATNLKLVKYVSFFTKKYWYWFLLMLRTASA